MSIDTAQGGAAWAARSYTQVFIWLRYFNLFNVGIVVIIKAVSYSCTYTDKIAPLAWQSTTQSSERSCFAYRSTGIGAAKFWAITVIVVVIAYIFVRVYKHLNICNILLKIRIGRTAGHFKAGGYGAIGIYNRLAYPLNS